MVGLLGRVVGGAMAGVGGAMEDEAKASGLDARQQRLVELNHGFRLDEMRQTDVYQTARDATQFANQTERDARLHSNNLERDSTNNTAALGRANVHASRSGHGDSEGGLSIEEGRLVAAAKAGLGDLSAPEKYDIFIDRIRAFSNPRLNNVFGVEDHVPTSAKSEIDATARRRAEKETAEKDGFIARNFSKDYFTETEGDPVAYLTRREQELQKTLTREYLDKRSGRNADTAKPDAPAQSAPPKTAPAAAEPPPQKAPPSAAPPGASAPPLDRLTPGKVTTFQNGQRWTLVDGKPQQVN
jgi:hypothetical protein